MGLEFVNPKNAPQPAANYSNLAIVPAGYRLLVIAGQIGNLSDGSIVEGLEAISPGIIYLQVSNRFS